MNLSINGREFLDLLSDCQFTELYFAGDNGVVSGCYAMILQVWCEYGRLQRGMKCLHRATH